LGHFSQQGTVVVGGWLRQGIPAHHALGVFAAVKVQQLQIHGALVRNRTHCRRKPNDADCALVLDTLINDLLKFCAKNPEIRAYLYTERRALVV
jgi:hypothetical protein